MRRGNVAILFILLAFSLAILLFFLNKDDYLNWSRRQEIAEMIESPSPIASAINFSTRKMEKPDDFITYTIPKGWKKTVRPAVLGYPYSEIGFTSDDYSTFGSFIDTGVGINVRVYSNTSYEKEFIYAKENPPVVSDKKTISINGYTGFYYYHISERPMYITRSLNLFNDSYWLLFNITYKDRNAEVEHQAIVDAFINSLKFK